LAALAGVSVRRLVILGLFVAAAVALTLLVEAPPRRAGEAAVRGPRVFKIAAASVSRVEVTIGEHAVAADRGRSGWVVGGVPADETAEGAIDDLVETLVRLRAIDRFRPNDGAHFGLDPPRATVTLANARRRTRLDLGELNAARSAVYARRSGSPHVMIVGLYLVSALERVVHFATTDRSEVRGERTGRAG
jgi:hypothetical protein